MRPFYRGLGRLIYPSSKQRLSIHPIGNEAFEANEQMRSRPIFFEASKGGQAMRLPVRVKWTEYHYRIFLGASTARAS